MGPDILYEVLYTSELLPTVSARAFAQLVREARRRNAASGITSLLVFDGVRVCHALEGAPPVVHALLGRIAADTRHTGWRLLHSATRGGDRRFAGHPMGYGLALHDADVDGVLACTGAAAVDALVLAMPRLELEP